MPGSIFIGLDGGFAPWVGAIVKDVQQSILLITPNDRLEETITRLSRVGFDNVVGYLEGGFESWQNSKKDVDVIESVNSDQFAELVTTSSISVVDVPERDRIFLRTPCRCPERTIGQTQSPPINV